MRVFVFNRCVFLGVHVAQTPCRVRLLSILDAFHSCKVTAKAVSSSPANLISAQCSGLFYIRPTPAALDLLDRAVHRVETENGWDQAIINEVGFMVEKMIWYLAFPR